MIPFDKLNNFYSKLNYNIKKKKIELNITYTKELLCLTKIFYDLGYIASYRIFNNKIFINMKVYKNNLLLQQITCISSPGRMIYCKNNKLNYYNNNIYNLIISSPKGFITTKEAIASNLGGFILFKFK